MREATMNDSIMRGHHKIAVVLFDFGGVIAEEGFKQGDKPDRVVI
jgi:hypothetical protein